MRLSLRPDAWGVLIVGTLTLLAMNNLTGLSAVEKGTMYPRTGNTGLWIGENGSKVVFQPKWFGTGEAVIQSSGGAHAHVR